MANRIDMTRFSAVDRKNHLEKIQAESFDVLVIGGGATGCGIALDAASRGLKTLLLEKGDFASGTSSKSTKLIHGGLRYLKQFEFGLVRETGTERAIVHRLAPHLVLPEKMLLPIVEGGTYSKLAASFGVMLYDILAGVTSDDRRKMLSAADTSAKEPLLRTAGLKGSCYFAEYRTDDARLTIELMKSAVAEGAKALNYCEVKDFVLENGKIVGVMARDVLTHQSFRILAHQVVSAAGPWVDGLRKRDHSLQGKRLHLTRGTHIVFPHEKLPLRQSVYFDVPDGRMVFAIPRGRATYVGTTDTNYQGDPDAVRATQEDVDYLLHAARHAFPEVPLAKEDVVSNWAGLRPLIHEDGKSPSELSRKDEIFVSSSGLISIAGGKLTGYRKMAQRIVDRVVKILGKAALQSRTKNLPLTPDPIPDAKSVQTYIEGLSESVRSKGLETYHAWYLTTNYGRQAEEILQKMAEISVHYNDPPEILLIRAEAWFCVHKEMVHRLEDFFVRRTGRLYFDIHSIAASRKAIRDDLKHYLQWSPERTQAEDEGLDQLLWEATNFLQKENNPQQPEPEKH